MPSAEAQPFVDLSADDISARYRRTAKALGDVDAPLAGSSGPATGRIGNDEASRLAKARANAASAKQIADPITETDPASRLSKARASAKPSGVAAGDTEKKPTLRDQAIANPKRTRNAVGASAAATGAGVLVDPGLNYNTGWPSGHSGVGYGTWDDNWSSWVNHCHSGGNPWTWHGHWNWHWSWHGNYWGCYPYSSSYWWWGTLWFPVYWYSNHSPAHVVIYDDPTPTTVVIQQVPAYGDPVVGEGVVEEDTGDAGTPVVDESMSRLLSPAGASSSRTAMQNLSHGDSAFRAGRFGDAVHYYAKAIEFQPDEGVLYLVLSDALFATGDYHYGAYALRKALELDPTLLDNPVDKHAFYGEPKEFDQQLAVLETYLKDRPTDQDARLLLAANYLFGTRPAAAVDLLESVPGESLRQTPVGALLLEAARRQQYDAAKTLNAK